MSSKLYTEEQVRKAMVNWSDCPMQDVIDSLTPIELPSDDEIDNASLIFSNGRVDFIKGAKWLRDKIGGKNEQ